MSENVDSINCQHFCLNLPTGTLWRGAQALHLRPKTFSVLQYLVEHPDQLVTKDAILDAVWPDVVVTDIVVGVCIRELRRALGDTAKQPQWIETVYKRGYRYIGNLKVLHQPVVASDTAPIADTYTTNNTSTLEKSRRNLKPTSPMSQPEGCESIALADALPTIWMVPHLRNSHFVGRSRLLASLRETLISGERATLTQAICGLGGIGKTQLVTEYAYRYAHCYHAILWVGGDSPTSLTTQYIHVAQYLNLIGVVAGDYSAIVAVVRQWFEQHSNWLIIFDNVEEPGLVRPYLPKTEKGHVLITSRNANWGGLANVLAVPPLERTEAVAFLQRRTKQQDPQAATTLAETLGNLPLALEQAAAYIETTGITLAGYCERFASFSDELLQREQTSTGYASSLATTWALAFEEVQRVSPLAEKLLALCAFLSPDAISRDELREGLRCLLGIPVSSVAIDDAIATLRYHSLVDAGPTTVSVHRLVQAVTRQRLQSAERQTAIECAVSTIHNLLARTQRSQDATSYTRLLPHAAVVASYAKELPATHQHWQRELGLLIAYGQLLTAVKGYAASEVKTTYERAWSLARTVESSELGQQALEGLTVYHITRAKLEKAQLLAEQRLTIAQTLEDRANRMRAQHHLGQIVFHRGGFPHALSYFMEAINQYEQLPNPLSALPQGVVHPAVACASYAAWSMWVLGFPNQASQQIQRAMLLAQELEHPFSLAFVLLCKCGVHQLRGEVVSTQEYAETLIDLARKQVFPFWLALGHMMRGWALTVQDRYKAGIPELREGLSAYQALGAALTQPQWLGLLADAYGRGGQADEGLIVIDRAIELAATTSELCYISVLHRIRGELVLRSSSKKCAEVADCFHRAITTAREQDAKSLELRATISMCRLWQKQGNPSGVREIITPLYDWFVEGFDTVLLQQAKALLESR